MGCVTTLSLWSRLVVCLDGYRSQVKTWGTVGRGPWMGRPCATAGATSGVSVLTPSWGSGL